MRRIIIMSLFLIFNLILQSTIFQYIEIYQINPNFLIIIIVSYAIIRGDIEGAILGFFAGLIQDLFFGRLIGINALLGMFTGYVAGKPFKDFNMDNYLLPLVLVVVASFFYEISFYAMNYLFRARLDFMFYFYRIIFPETIYNLVLCPFVYAIVILVNRRIEVYEKGTNKLF